MEEKAMATVLARVLHNPLKASFSNLAALSAVSGQSVALVSRILRERER
jgi:hypothetical protein